MHKNIYWHLLFKVPGLGQQSLGLLFAHFKDGESAWKAEARDYKEAGLQEKVIAGILSSRSSFSTEEDEALFLKEGIDILVAPDPIFPNLLKEIPKPPSLIYTRGTIEEWNKRKYIAIVGSRKYTAYGKQATEHIAQGLTHAGYTIVSGLAFGIDRVAHEAALANGGETVAILADGLDQASIAPQSHLRLSDEVRKNGSLLSEYPPGTQAAPGFFPARNRLIAGLSLGTIVIEAAEKSGSLITASLSLDFNREVFAVPGSIFSPASEGTNTLIKNGAKIVRNLSDILEELAPSEGTLSLFESTENTRDTRDNNLSDEEKKIFALLSSFALPVDEIIKSSHLGASAVSSALTMLEIKGLANNVGRNHYIKT